MSAWGCARGDPLGIYHSRVQCAAVASPSGDAGVARKVDYDGKGNTFSMLYLYAHVSVGNTLTELAS